MIHTYRQCSQDMRRDQGSRPRLAKGMDISKLHATQTAVTNFMLDTIRSINAHTYRVYPGAKNKSNPAYPNVNSSAATKVIRPATMSMWEKANILPLNWQIDTMMRQARATYFGT